MIARNPISFDALKQGNDTTQEFATSAKHSSAKKSCPTAIITMGNTIL